MQSFQPHLIHLVGYRVAAIASQTIHAGTDKEMRANVLRCAEQLVDVALTVTNVDATLRLTEKRRRLPQVFQPAIAFLFLDRLTRRIDLFLRCVAALEFAAGLKFYRRQNSRKRFLSRSSRKLQAAFSSSIQVCSSSEDGGRPGRAASGVPLVVI